MSKQMLDLPESTSEQREYKAYKLRQMRTQLSLEIKRLEKPADAVLPLTELQAKGA